MPLIIVHSTSGHFGAPSIMTILGSLTEDRNCHVPLYSLYLLKQTSSNKAHIRAKAERQDQSVVARLWEQEMISPYAERFPFGPELLADWTRKCVSATLRQISKVYEACATKAASNELQWKVHVADRGVAPICLV